jgi:hypothetical protein
MLLPQIIRINLIILLIFGKFLKIIKIFVLGSFFLVAMTSIDCRTGDRGRDGRVRAS